MTKLGLSLNEAKTSVWDGSPPPSKAYPRATTGDLPPFFQECECAKSFSVKFWWALKSQIDETKKSQKKLK